MMFVRVTGCEVDPHAGVSSRVQPWSGRLGGVWGPEWAWQSVEGLGLDQVERDLTRAGYAVLSYVQRRDDGE
jgi:hypothetical protein